MSKNTLKGLVAGLTATSIWGGMYVVSKAVMAVIPPFSLITLRLILGILTLLIVLPRSRTKITVRQFWSIFGTGIVGYGISLGFQFVGTNLSTASAGSLVTSATPAFIILFAYILLKEKITLRSIASLLIATLGVVAVIAPRAAFYSSPQFIGNLPLVAAALTWALYSVLIRKLTQNIDVKSISLIAFVGGLPICLPLALHESFTTGYGEISTGVIVGVLFLGIVSTALAMFLWNTAFAKLEARKASLTFFAQPVVGTFLGALVLGEKITPLFLLGGLLIGIGLLISTGMKSD